MGFWQKLGSFFAQNRPVPRTRNMPKRELAPVAEIVEQSMQVADVATRLEVKNRIIMNALKKHEDYDGVKVRRIVKDTLLTLAEEREADADRIRDVRRDLQVYGRSAMSETEYSSEDIDVLEHRQQVYTEIAKELRVWAADAAYLDKTAIASWESAWGEIGESLKEKASHPYYGGGNTEEYKNLRGSRMAELAADLHDLTSPKQEQGGFFTRILRRGRKQ